MKKAVIIILIIFASASGFMAVVEHEIYTRLGMVILALIFLAGAVGILRHKLFGCYVSIGTISLALLFYLWRIARRAVFVIQEGGLERRDGQGSPLAFLIGLAFELFILTLLGGFIAWLIDNRKQFKTNI